MRRALYPALVRAVQRGVPMIAPCNGFQTAAQMGLLPGPDGPGTGWPSEPPRPTVALASNASATFVDRWVAIDVPDSTRCVWTRGLEMTAETALLPVAHGEGRFVPGSRDLLEHLEANGQVALRYAPGDNPNGSVGDVAGICDATGLVFGLMPHPERYTRWTQHPWWTRLAECDRAGDPPGLQMFKSAVAHACSLRAVGCEA
jgi:phosphoribosylformylglycinamidine synthase